MKNLESLTVKELKGLCKEHNLVGYSKMRKAELVEILNQVDMEADTTENAEIASTEVEATENAEIVEVHQEVEDINIEELAQNKKLKIDALTGNFVSTKGQRNAIRFLIYNYKIKVDYKNIINRRECSELITKIYKEIKAGNIERRTVKYPNQQIKLVGDYYTLVIAK